MNRFLQQKFKRNLDEEQKEDQEIEHHKVDELLSEICHIDRLYHDESVDEVLNVREEARLGLQHMHGLSFEFLVKQQVETCLEMMVEPLVEKRMDRELV